MTHAEVSPHCLGPCGARRRGTRFRPAGLGGTYFWVDPKEKQIAILMLQAPSQRDYYRALFRNLVYAALVK